MSKEHPTRRDLMKPVQLLGLALIAALFSGLVTLISMGFFQQRFATQSMHALVVAGIVAGIAFIVTIVVIALLLLAVDPAEITRPLDHPVLLPPGAPAPAAADAAAVASETPDAAGPGAAAPETDGPHTESDTNAPDAGSEPRA